MVKSIKYYFAAPFVPVKTFRELESRNNSAGIFWFVLVAHLILTSLFGYLKYSHEFRHLELDKGLFLFGFIFGFGGRTFFIAYILWFSMRRVFRKSVTYILCVNIVLITLLPLCTGILFGTDFGIFGWLGIMYSSILIALAFVVLMKVDFSKMLALVISSHLLIWFLHAPFSGMRI